MLRCHGRFNQEEDQQLCTKGNQASSAFDHGCSQKGVVFSGGKYLSRVEKQILDSKWMKRSEEGTPIMQSL